MLPLPLRLESVQACGPGLLDVPSEGASQVLAHCGLSSNIASLWPPHQHAVLGSGPAAPSVLPTPSPQAPEGQGEERAPG